MRSIGSAEKLTELKSISTLLIKLLTDVLTTPQVKKIWQVYVKPSCKSTLMRIFVGVIYPNKRLNMQSNKFFWRMWWIEITWLPNGASMRPLSSTQKHWRRKRLCLWQGELNSMNANRPFTNNETKWMPLFSRLKEWTKMSFLDCE